MDTGSNRGETVSSASAEIAAVALSAKAGEFFETYLNSARASKKEFSPDKLERLYFGRILVSLWSHAAMSDGKLHKSEHILISRLVGSLFEEGSLFTAEDLDSPVIDILIETFAVRPIPLKEIGSVACLDRELALFLFEDLCCIVASDGTLRKEEEKLLNQAAALFRLKRSESKTIKKRYLRSTTSSQDELLQKTKGRPGFPGPYLFSEGAPPVEA